MPALLALIPAKDWLWAAVFAAALIFGVHEHHKILAEGIAEQKAADDKATAALVAATEKQTAELQAKATQAEQAYDKQQADLANYRSSNPVQPVRLCLDTHSGGSGVPKGSATVAGNASAGTAPGNVLPLPAGDSSGGAGASGPDIGNLLELLSARADQVSAELAEYQAR
jgi:hypothetical protein